jgi:hypothetical protein
VVAGDDLLPPAVPVLLGRYRGQHSLLGFDLMAGMMLGNPFAIEQFRADRSIFDGIAKPCPCGGRAELCNISEHGCFCCDTITYTWACQACGAVERKGCKHVWAFIHLGCPWCEETVLVKVVKGLLFPEQEWAHFFCKACNKGAIMATCEDEAASVSANRLIASIRENPTFALPKPSTQETWRDRAIKDPVFW